MDKCGRSSGQSLDWFYKKYVTCYYMLGQNSGIDVILLLSSEKKDWIVAFTDETPLCAYE